MSDEPISAADLVTEKVLDPAADHDPAARLNPAKVEKVAPKAAKPRKAPKAKREAAKNAATRAADAKAEAASQAASSHAEHRRAKRDEADAAYAAAKVHQVANFSDLPKGKLELRLAGHGHFVLGQLAVARSEMKAHGADRATLNKDIDIGPNGEPVSVDEAWLIAESGEAVCCAVGPLSAGNGHHARIPAGHLIF